MANSLDPDQTAPEGYALFGYAIFSEALVFKILGHLPYLCFHVSSLLPSVRDYNVYFHQTFVLKPYPK